VLASLALLITAGGVVLTTGWLGNDSGASPTPSATPGPEPAVAGNDVITISFHTILVRGFEHPVTHDPITCSDGSLLKQTLRGREVRGPAFGPVACPDGSTPAAFANVKAHWRSLESRLTNAPFGQPTPNANDLSFVIRNRSARPDELSAGAKP